MIYFYVVIALVAGALMPVQAGVNSQLARYVGHPVVAALVSFAVGTLALFAYAVALRQPAPELAALRGSPWWVWIGGLFGAFFVAAAAAYAPRLGAATFISITVAGQMFVSLVLDHYGLLGFAEKHASAPRLLGAALLVAGVVLIRKF